MTSSSRRRSAALGSDAGADLSATTVGDAMLRRPTVLAHTATLREVTDRLRDPHVHMVLLVRDSPGGRHLAGTVVPDDLLVGPGRTAGPQDAFAGQALAVAQLCGRVVPPDVPAERVRREMAQEGVRRLAVVDPRGRLLGLLCLKSHGRGFCSDAGVDARRADRTHRAIADPGCLGC